MDKVKVLASPSLADDFRRLVADVTDTPESVGIDLRIQFSSLMGKMLKERGWSQTELSRRTKIHQPEISAYMHADENVTVDTMGRILHALGPSDSRTPRSPSSSHAFQFQPQPRCP